MKNRYLFFLIAASLLINSDLVAQEVYELPKGIKTRWITYENPYGVKGQGGKENGGKKGHAFDHIKPGERKTIFNVKGSGIIHRIWITGGLFNENEMRMKIRLEMYWDGSEKPAVSVPLNAFFGGLMGYMVPFESCFLSSPEGRSYCSFFQMPFRKSAKIVLTNESEKLYQPLFIDISYSTGVKHLKNAMYFHCFWNSDKPPVGSDYMILPELNGKGRILGAFIGVDEDDSYQRTWWGEGEVKIFLDDDNEFPTLVGTGTEDYPGTGYGLRRYINQYQGATVADNKEGDWIFYRFHEPDPIFFYKNVRITIQQMGGAGKKQVLDMKNSGVPLTPVTARMPYSVRKFLEEDKIPDLSTDEIPDQWINFLRSDRYTSVVYFYLNMPVNNL